MSAAGKSALRNYLLGGGRVITGEWFIYNLTGDTILGPVLPVTYCGAGARNVASVTYNEVEPTDSIIHSGMPASFNFSPDGSYAGTCLTPVSGAKAFYLADTQKNGTVVTGVVGRVLSGGGRVISISTSAGVLEPQNDDYRRLFRNGGD